MIKEDIWRTKGEIHERTSTDCYNSMTLELIREGNLVLGLI